MKPKSAAFFRFLLRTYLGSPSKGSPPGFKMSQNMRATALCSSGRHGRIWKVSGSGFATISLSSIRAKPSIDEPSKPIPSSNAPSSSSTEIAKLFRTPRISVNHRRMNRTSFSFAILRTYSLLSVFLSFFGMIIQPPVYYYDLSIIRHYRLNHLF